MFPLPGLVVAAALFVLPATGLRAQRTGDAPTASTPAAPALPPPGTAALEERIAAARSVRVMTSILGIELGSELDEAHEKLDKLCAPGTRPKEEGGDDEAKDQKAKGQAAGERSEHKPKAGEEDEEGHKVLWTLGGTNYSAIYITADDKERIDSITGFLRPDQPMPFEAVGEVAKAPVKDGKAVIWDVLREGRPLFRVVAQGADGKANTLRIFVVQRKPGAAVYHPAEGTGK